MIINRTVVPFFIIFILLSSIYSYSEEVADTKFQYGRGFYISPFEENISTETPGATIVYTLDGSDPTVSNTAVEGESPLSVLVDPESTQNRPQTPGVILRAYAKKSGMTPTNVDGQTYIFTAAVEEQSSQTPGGGWPDESKDGNYTINGQVIKYGVKQDVVEDGRWDVKEALLAIPSMSIVSSLDNWFDPATGLYSNSNLKDESSVEIQGTLELINPDKSKGFYVNTGIRIRGGYSSNQGNPKHSYRFFFRSEYGDSKLKYPLFGNEGVSRFDKIDFRTAQNESWHAGGTNKNTYLRDVFGRDLQGAAGQPYTKSRYYHVYMNGMYWGLFMTQERAEAKFGASYFGGDDNDYDVLKARGWQDSTEITDGNAQLFEEIFDRTKNWSGGLNEYLDLIGLNNDGSPDPNGTKLIDPGNIIDYMIGLYFTGSKDEGATQWEAGRPNNFFCMINRITPDGVKCFHHDGEWSMDVGAKNVTDYPGGENYKRFGYFNSVTLHEHLKQSDEYMIQFADHTYKHFFNDGAMTPENALALFMERYSQVESAIAAEAARWGNADNKNPDSWKQYVDATIIGGWFPDRRDVVLEQLKSKGYYPSLNPPLVESNGSLVQSAHLETQTGTMVTVNNDDNNSGTIYYTLDSSDPRDFGGGLSESAIEAGSGETFVVEGTTLKARVKDGENWSPLREIALSMNIGEQDLQITEIQYHTYDDSTGIEVIDDRNFEFIELHNSGSEGINSTGLSFREGVLYSFPDGAEINSGEYIVLASDSDAFEKRYGFKPFGTFLGNLDNGGETLVLVDLNNTVVDSVTYDDDHPWNTIADGSGKSLSLIAATSITESNNPEHWSESLERDGTPGAENEFYSEPESSSSEEESSLEESASSEEASSQLSSSDGEGGSSDDTTPIIQRHALHQSSAFQIISNRNNQKFKINVPNMWSRFKVYTVTGEVILEQGEVLDGVAALPADLPKGVLVLQFL